MNAITGLTHPHRWKVADERPLVRAKGMSRRQQAILTAHTVRDTPNLDVTP